MLSRHPGFADVFVAIGRLGRSLGMHLLLASQRLEEGPAPAKPRLPIFLPDHLKTLSRPRSPDGARRAGCHLPARPGAAYLKAAARNRFRFAPATYRRRCRHGPALPRVRGCSPVTKRPAPMQPGRRCCTPSSTWWPTRGQRTVRRRAMWLAHADQTPAWRHFCQLPGRCCGSRSGWSTRCTNYRRDPLVIDLSKRRRQLHHRRRTAVGSPPQRGR